MVKFKFLFDLYTYKYSMLKLPSLSKFCHPKNILKRENPIIANL
jgi:hypothetical protein